MKFLTIIAVMLTLTSTGQTPWKEIPNKTNKIAITSDKTIKEVSTVLVLDGFTIEKSDSELGYILTDFKTSAKANIQLRFVFTDGKIILSGNFLSGISIAIYGVRTEDQPQPIYKVASRASILGKAFDEMMRVAYLLDEEIQFITE